ncbi:uncharacterized protein LOC106160905 [Lingula anatina]|uniref:Uncharacterized protein LOC106157568 n=1 Tax=Lingula anatina TaxID=7574 RepID=A0A1S3I5L6_LINAN|nr:uncharacterized protein LOC106157568 [Lingula anatina]XP_013388716.1 uncharacterized protein LOC106157568 [Lingula anatina]XP_013393131.1 uncharacterized protein LOC106160905 [Lingula anatina]|eukprot:XP_013388715.1 uncharacterized protein LOC106157568 [Lingula anatina]
MPIKKRKKIGKKVKNAQAKKYGKSAKISKDTTTYPGTNDNSECVVSSQQSSEPEDDMSLSSLKDVSSDNSDTQQSNESCRFLLSKGVAFVLADHFNQDPLEQYFPCREMRVVPMKIQTYHRSTTTRQQLEYRNHLPWHHFEEIPARHNHKEKLTVHL